jgi:hypothetical protein
MPYFVEFRRAYGLIADTAKKIIKPFLGVFAAGRCFLLVIQARQLSLLC